MIAEELVRQAKDLINRSESVLIVLPESMDLDNGSSAALLAGRIVGQSKNFAVVTANRAPARWENLPLSALSSASGILQDLIITIDTSDAAIGGLRYEKDETKLSVVLSPKDQPLDLANVKIKFGAGDADCIIVIGASNLDGLGEFYHKNPRLFFETPIINIDNSPANENFGEINLVDPKAEALVEISWILARAVAPYNKLSPNEATLALAGIISSMNNFLGQKIGPETLSLAAEAIISGADRRAILDALGPIKPPSVLQLFGRAVLRSRYSVRRMPRPFRGGDEGAIQISAEPTHFGAKRPDAPHFSVETFYNKSKNQLITIITADDFSKTGTTPQDIPSILRLIAERFETPAIYLLLFQDPNDKQISAVISSPSLSALQKIGHRLNTLVRQESAWLSTRYRSFIEAEETLADMLADIAA